MSRKSDSLRSRLIRASFLDMSMDVRSRSFAYSISMSCDLPAGISIVWLRLLSDLLYGYGSPLTFNCFIGGENDSSLRTKQVTSRFCYFQVQCFCKMNAHHNFYHLFLSEDKGVLKYIPNFSTEHAIRWRDLCITYNISFKNNQ